jgi:hypothetical protein
MERYCANLTSLEFPSGGARGACKIMTSDLAHDIYFLGCGAKWIRSSKFRVSIKGRATWVNEGGMEELSCVVGVMR